MGRYFINKLTNQPSYVGESTPSVLNRRLTETYQVGTEVITIDGQQIEQPKLELVWKEISKEEFDALNPKEPEFTIDPIEQERMELEKEADELGKDFKQDYVGLYIPNLEEKKARYIAIDTRLRELNGKKPRILK